MDVSKLNNENLCAIISVVRYKSERFKVVPTKTTSSDYLLGSINALYEIEKECIDELKSRGENYG